MFNHDVVVQEMLRVGKSIQDARNGGTSGCVETGAFGKENYNLTGYFNIPKVLELTLQNGYDPRTKKQLGPKTGDPIEFGNFDELYEAFEKQMRHFIDRLTGEETLQRSFGGDWASTVEDARAAVVWTKAAYRSAEQGVKIKRGELPL